MCCTVNLCPFRESYLLELCDQRERKKESDRLREREEKVLQSVKSSQGVSDGRNGERERIREKMVAE